METKAKIIIIGGSAAGAKAAAKARRLNQHAEITIIQKDPDLSMASCGYPYYVGGVFDDRKMLLATPVGVVRDPGFFKKTKNIIAKTETEVIEIDRKNKSVLCKDLSTNEDFSLHYDKLIVTTGAKPIVPPVKGINLQGVTNLLSMQDADFLRKIRDEKNVKKAVVVGGGLIGVETCEALIQSGIEVTVLEAAPQILPFLDSQLARLTENHMKAKGVDVRTNSPVTKFLGEAGKLTGVRLVDETIIYCQLAVVATGVAPHITLAKKAGLTIGERGGIATDEHMMTSDPDIYAAGDCIEVTDLITGAKVLSPMGDLANLQGRVAGENAALGNTVSFPGTMQSGICKIFDFTAGSTGLSDKSVAKMSDKYVSVLNAGQDKPGFMGAGLLISKMLVEKETMQIHGFQCVGNGDVSRQVATAAMAIQGKMTLDQLVCSDLPYAPPFSPAIDNFIATAHILENKIKGRIKGISAEEVAEKIEKDEQPYFLDGRGPDEIEVLRLGIGEHYIPLGALRDRLHELPDDKDAEIICFCKISLRGYEAALIIEAAGWRNVKVMEGGIMAWPYSREK